MKIHYIHKDFFVSWEIASYETKKTLREDAHSREEENMSQATARDARMCQGTFFTSFLREKEKQKNTGFFHEAENGNSVFRTD